MSQAVVPKCGTKNPATTKCEVGAGGLVLSVPLTPYTASLRRRLLVGQIEASTSEPDTCSTQATRMRSGVMGDLPHSTGGSHALAAAGQRECRACHV